MSLIKGSNNSELPKAAHSSAVLEGHAEKSAIVKGRELEREGGESPSRPKAILKRGEAVVGAMTVFEPIHVVQEGAAEFHSADPEGGSRAHPVRPDEDLPGLQEKAEELLLLAKKEAERTMHDAQTKAKKLIEQSKLYSETAHSNARREGFSVGQEAGKEAAMASAKAILQTARDTLEQVMTLHDELALSMEAGLAKLAIKIAEKVIAREVSLDPDLVIAMVRSQLEKMKDRDRVVIHVHPDDFENVKYKKDLFRQFAPQVRSIDIEADARVDRGGCMIETDLGTVDASISTQLEAIELAFGKVRPPTGESDGSGAKTDA